MTQSAKQWTREEAAALPNDGCRYEVIDGELLVSPTPHGRHQRAVVDLEAHLERYLRHHHLNYYTGTAPADLDLAEAQLVQPDLFVSAFRENEPPVGPDSTIPRLIVEVIAPSTAHADRFDKRYCYQRAGVPAYWIVHLEGRLVEVWRPDSLQPEIVDRQLEWHPDPATPPLVIDLVKLFHEVWAE